MIETLILSAWIAVIITAIRASRRRAAEVWAAACWWEKAVLLLFFVPVPGPFDEIAAAFIAARILRRIRQTSVQP